MRFKVLFLILLVAGLVFLAPAVLALEDYSPDDFRDDGSQACETKCRCAMEWGPEKKKYVWSFCSDRDVTFQKELRDYLMYQGAKYQVHDFYRAHLQVTINKNECDLDTSISQRTGYLVSGGNMGAELPYGARIQMEAACEMEFSEKWRDAQACKCTYESPNALTGKRQSVVIEDKGEGVKYVDPLDVNEKIDHAALGNLYSIIKERTYCPGFVKGVKSADDIRCEPIFPAKSCCCRLVESGTQTKKYICAETDEYPGFPSSCRAANPNDQSAYQVLPYPVKENYPNIRPENVTCDVYRNQGSAYESKEELNMGDTTKRVRQEAAAFLNPAGFTSAPQVVGRLIRFLMAFIGMVLFVFYIVAGITWMTAAGNSERIDSAKRILIWSTLGVAVMLASYIIVSFFFDNFFR